MYSVTFIWVLTAATFAAAAAVSFPNSTNLPPNFNVDDVILYGLGGRMEVMSRAEYMLSPNHMPIATAEQHDTKINQVQAEEPTRTIEKRCPKETVWTFNPVETFVDWDIAISGTVLAPPFSNTTVTVGDGHSIGNSLSVSTSGKFQIVEKFLTFSLGIPYSASWTTTYSTTLTFSVPSGKFGAIVSNPLTIRHSGYMDVGCIGSSTRTEFTSDTYRGRSYSDLTWVEGVIGLCLGDTYPLQRCNGNGTL